MKDKISKLHEANVSWADVVRRRGERLRLSEVESQERRARPGYDEGGKLDDGEGEELPWDPEVEKDQLARVLAD